ncbi:MAG: hypothetical protein O3A10_09175 [Chloroflexi bacterium]|nr:hypothetical protein [Chloroflexota bacterium]MDA1146640.1 hypothetical protein [Chloroflexota bacterium]MQC82818.1 hypothetical protein [Chloroflexota bacterium]
MPIVHTIAARWRPEADPSAIDRAMAAARDLAGAPGVEATHAGCSASHLVAAVWLPEASALEPFAASALHMTFVMRGLAPVVAGMWSVSISTDEAAPALVDPVAIWAFAVPEAEGVFEWQIRRQLEAVRALPGQAWAGPTVEERERYRAGGVVLLGPDELDSFDGAARTVALDTLNLETAFAPIEDGTPP